MAGLPLDGRDAGDGSHRSANREPEKITYCKRKNSDTDAREGSLAEGTPV